MKVTIYTTTTCPYCKLLKTYLKEKNIPFTEKVIDTDDAARKEMEKISGGFLGVPYSVIVKDDGTEVKIVGFDKGKFNETLGISA